VGIRFHEQLDVVGNCSRKLLKHNPRVRAEFHSLSKRHRNRGQFFGR
jgi:hypothetical protein